MNDADTRGQVGQRPSPEAPGTYIHGVAASTDHRPSANALPDSAAPPRPIQCLFVDIGGVLLSNGWDHHARQRAAAHFNLTDEWDDIETRHRMVFELYEVDKLSLDDYLDRVVFNRKRSFSRAQFRDFMYAQSSACPDMIELIVQLKQRYQLKIVVLSNEARELNDYRIRTFALDRFVDTFVSSSFVHLRKPDPGIFRLALDLAQAAPDCTAMIDNTAMFVEVAKELGMYGIVHTDTDSTRTQLALLGLTLDGFTADASR